MSANAPSLADLLAAAELSEPRPFGELISRLTADGRLRGARDGGRAIGPAALAGIEVRGITDDSRKVGRGALFVAVPGLHVDGHDFVAAAARAGAVAALVERPVVDVTLPQLVVDRAPRALADAAAWWYGDPSRHLGIVGITGTDGKTTTCFLAIAALEAAGLSTGLTGTVETQIGHRREANPAPASSPTGPIRRLTSAPRTSPRTPAGCGSRSPPRPGARRSTSASRVGSTFTTHSRSSPSARSSGSTRRPSATASPRCRASLAGWNGSTPASRSGSSSTTPTAPPRSRRCSASWRRLRPPVAAS